MNSIIASATTDATLFNGTANNGQLIENAVTIRYPNNTPTKDTRNLLDRGPIEVTVDYKVAGLTPLFQLFSFGSGDGTINLRVTQRRSIENLGVDPTQPTGAACARDVAHWRQLNPP